MKYKIILEDKKGYVEHINDVSSIKIKKINNINNLIIYNREHNNMPLVIDLKDIKMFFMFDKETLDEIFRYEK